MFVIKEGRYNQGWSLSAILRDSAVVVVRAMITTRKSIDGFPLLSYMVIRLRSSALTTEAQNYIIIIVF